MTQPAKAQEPSMEEILASIRRIIADDDANKSPPRAADPMPPPPTPMAQQPLRPVPPPAPPPPPPRPVAAAPPPPRPAPPPPEPEMKQDDIDSMIDDFDKATEPEKPDVLDLTESMAAAPRAEGFRTIDGQSDVVFND